MDFIALTLSLWLQSAQSMFTDAQNMTRPGTVDVARMQSSFPELTRGILTCYHRTAKYQVAQVLESPWAGQSRYGAKASALIQIRYTGVTGAPYFMHVALLGTQNAFRTSVVLDSANIPYSKDCSLEQWTRS